MTIDEQQIRTLIEQWAVAVHRGDMTGVLADHADDVVMFDVPPPQEGVRGLAAYRETWPQFFEYQANGATFDIVELQITAGGDVAYAYALLRCGSREELAHNPASRLRLTLGLRKEQDRWTVAHEHHSFPAPQSSDSEGRVLEASDREAEFPEPHPELRRLEPLLGAWTSHDHTRESILGPGVPVTNEETYAWFDGGHFLVSTYMTQFGDEPTQRGVNYWGYDDDAGRFRITFFSNNGPFTEAGSRYEGVVVGDTLTFEGPARFQYPLDQDGRVRTNPDGSICVEWWLRDEEGAWQPWMRNTFSRRPT